MVYLVVGKAREGYYDDQSWPYVTVVSDADSEDEAKEVGRHKIAMQSGHMATVDYAKPLDKSSYQKSVNTDFEEPWYEQNLVAFDVETTGFDPSDDEIVELGFARLSEDGFDDVTTLFVGDADTMPEDAQKVNGISDDMFVDKPTFAERFDDNIRPILEDADALIAHNRGFDAGFLFHRMKEDGIEASVPPFFCSQLMAINCSNVAETKLQNVCEELGISSENAHRAGDDARVCGEVFLALARRMSYFRPPCSMRDAITFFDEAVGGNYPSVYATT